MRFLKATAIALVVGGGMALVSTQARAQDSTSTYTSSISGNTEVNSFEGSFTALQLSSTSTRGDAIAAAASNPIFGTTSFSGSLAGGSTTGPETSNNIEPTVFYPGQLGGVLSGGGSTTDDGSSSTLAVNYVKLWASASNAETQGSITTSGTTSTGTSVAGLFVFGQTTAVSEDGSLTDSDPIGPIVAVNAGDFNGSSGQIALNQVAGVGNQQGNNLSTLLEVSGANSTTAGSNSVNVEGSQTLADAGTIGDSYTTGESATIAAGTFQNVTGAITVNQAAGVANQQVNNVTLAH
jgi:hypothetical protein